MAAWRFKGKLLIERLANLHVVRALWAAFIEINILMKDIQSIMLRKFKVHPTVGCELKPEEKSKRGGNPLFEFINERICAEKVLNPRLSLREKNIAQADACEEYRRKVTNTHFHTAWLGVYRKRRKVGVRKNTKQIKNAKKT